MVASITSAQLPSCTYDTSTAWSTLLYKSKGGTILLALSYTTVYGARQSVLYGTFFQHSVTLISMESLTLQAEGLLSL